MTRLLAALVLLLALATPAAAGDEGCYPVPVTPNTPTGIAGCLRSGDGIASWYGAGTGGAMNFCTWAVRHDTGCGFALVTSRDTGKAVVVPIIDFCDCFTGTADERIIDLQTGVLPLLGLDPARGLYPVTVEPYGGDPPTLPDTATERESSLPLLLIGLALFILLLAAGGALLDELERRSWR